MFFNLLNSLYKIRKLIGNFNIEIKKNIKNRKKLKKRIKIKNKN